MGSEQTAYDAFAAQYAAMVERREAAGIAADPVVPPLLEQIGDVTGLAALDAGCGEGYLARLLAALGAHVTGMDASPQLIAMARAKDPAGAIEYRVADLSQPLPDYAARFDLIASHFVLNDVEDYQGFLATLGACARPGARVVLSLNNPYSFVVRGHIRDYFDAGRPVSYRGMAQQGVPVHFYQRTLEQYLDACFAAGLSLRKLVDVPTPEGSFMRQPGILIPEGHHFPFFTILRLTKT
jgi:2-polyprenyl-3-methyl-5-hydroxy-6-metoxy-1,4-benzoquinol methylase